MLRKHLTTLDGFVLYTTSVMGLGLIVLPSIAAREAGVWSVVIWLVLGVLSYPIARVMGELGSRHPSAGGVTTFIGHALGGRSSHFTSVLYLVAMLVGPTATGLFFADYLDVLWPLGPAGRASVAALFLWVLILVNMLNVETTMRVQRSVFYLFLALAIVGVATAIPYVDLDRISLEAARADFSLPVLLTTTFLCFHAFIGWEHAAFSSEEMLDSRSLVKAVLASVIAVTVIFTAFGIAVVGAVPPEVLATSNTALSDLLAVSVGEGASLITAFGAMIIIFMMMLTWVRGGSRLVYNMARQGQLFGALNAVDPKTGAPRRALLALGVAWTLSLYIFYAVGLDVEYYLRLANANYIMTYLIVFIAAIKLLWPEGAYRGSSVVALVAVVGLLAMGYEDLWYPAVTAVVFVALTQSARAWRNGRQRARDRA